MFSSRHGNIKKRWNFKRGEREREREREEKEKGLTETRNRIVEKRRGGNWMSDRDNWISCPGNFSLGKWNEGERRRKRVLSWELLTSLRNGYANFIRNGHSYP